MADPTPGPWERLAGTTKEGHKLGEGTLVIRIVPKRKPQETKFQRLALVDGENAMANACLIAAAPDLLAALKDVVSLSDRKHNAWDKAHAAIAKAENSQ